MNVTSIEPKYLISYTGYSFVDAGGLVIEYLLSKAELKGMNILQLISWVTDLYVDEWNLPLHALLPASPAVVFEYDNERKKQEILHYFREMLREQGAVTVARCFVIGNVEPLFASRRYAFMLAGTQQQNDLQNPPNAPVSKFVLIRLFFALFGMQRLTGVMYSPYSDNAILNRHIIFQNCEANFRFVSAGATRGAPRPGNIYPSWQVFILADYYLEVLDKRTQHEVVSDPGISLYYWRNTAEEPQITKYLLTANAFAFYRYCMLAFPEVWKGFMLGYTKADRRKFMFNYETGQWETKAGEGVTFQDIIQWPNTVTDALLHGRSLLPYFKKWCLIRSFPVEIVYQYAIIVRNSLDTSFKKLK